MVYKTFFDENKDVLGIMGIFIDVTNIKKKQKYYEERENVLRTIINTISRIIFYKDKDFKHKGNNKLDIESIMAKMIMKMVFYPKKEITKTSVINEDRQFLGILGLVNYIAQRFKLKEKLKKTRYIDNLTGVYNRASFEKTGRTKQQ